MNQASEQELALEAMVEVALEETLGGMTPPDLYERTRNRLQAGRGMRLRLASDRREQVSLKDRLRRLSGLRIAAAAACVVIGLILILRGGPSPETPRLVVSRAAGGDGKGFVAAEGIVTASGDVLEMKGSWALVHYDRRKLIAQGLSVEAGNGRALISTGGIPDQTTIDRMHEQLRKHTSNMGLTEEERTMATKGTSWRNIGAIALCVFAGNVMVNGERIAAEEVVAEPNATKELPLNWYTEINDVGLRTLMETKGVSGMKTPSVYGNFAHVLIDNNDAWLAYRNVTASDRVMLAPDWSNVYVVAVVRSGAEAAKVTLKEYFKDDAARMPATGDSPHYSHLGFQVEVHKDSAQSQDIWTGASVMLSRHERRALSIYATVSRDGELKPGGLKPDTIILRGVNRSSPYTFLFDDYLKNEPRAREAAHLERKLLVTAYYYPVQGAGTFRKYVEGAIAMYKDQVVYFPSEVQPGGTTEGILTFIDPIVGIRGSFRAIGSGLTESATRQHSEAEISEAFQSAIVTCSAYRQARERVEWRIGMLAPQTPPSPNAQRAVVNKDHTFRTLRGMTWQVQANELSDNQLRAKIEELKTLAQQYPLIKAGFVTELDEKTVADFKARDPNVHAAYSVEWTMSGASGLKHGSTQILEVYSGTNRDRSPAGISSTDFVFVWE